MDSILQSAWENTMQPATQAVQNDIFGDNLAQRDLVNSTPTGIHSRGKILDTQSKYEVVVDVKGFSPDDIAIEFVDNRRAIRVSGQAYARGTKLGAADSAKRASQSFSEKFYLPPGSDPATLMHDFSTDRSRLIITVMKNTSRHRNNLAYATSSGANMGELVRGTYTMRQNARGVRTPAGNASLSSPTMSRASNSKSAIPERTRPMTVSQKPRTLVPDYSYSGTGLDGKRTIYPNWDEPPIVYNMQTGNVFPSMAAAAAWGNNTMPTNNTSYYYIPAAAAAALPASGSRSASGGNTNTVHFAAGGFPLPSASSPVSTVTSENVPPRL